MLPQPSLLQSYVEELVRAESAALETALVAAVFTTRVDRIERLHVVAVASAGSRIPRAAACFTDDGWRVEKQRRLLATECPYHGPMSRRFVAGMLVEVACGACGLRPIDLLEDT